MAGLSDEQKVALSKLYKTGRKIVHTSSHIEYLTVCLESKVIPKSFKIPCHKFKIPGSQKVIQQNLDNVSYCAIRDEKEKHVNVLKHVKNEHEKWKSKVNEVFSEEVCLNIMAKLAKHLDKICIELRNRKMKKNFRDVTLAADDENILQAHRSNATYGTISTESSPANVTLVSDDGTSQHAHTSLYSDLADVTLVSDDDGVSEAHKNESASSSAEVTLVSDEEISQHAHENQISDSSDVTLVSDDEGSDAHKSTSGRKKRRFKRKWLQPQPKKVRKRKKKRRNESIVVDGLKEVIKNFTGIPVSDVENMLFARGKNFCPVELDPPFIRMQKELNDFYRLLRIKWHFRNETDQRSNLERKFYLKSNWMPPSACKEWENLISQIQAKFDQWKPPKFIKDNLTAPERKFLTELKNNKDVIYMWEDKGPSFTKLTVDQYIKAGEKELSNDDFYEVIHDDPTDDIKKQCTDLVVDMQRRKEISDSVADYLLSGEVKLSNFYHLVKTHSLPADSQAAQEWLDEKGFPIRGIISGVGAPTEKLAGLVDHFLQPGMAGLPTFLKDTKHTLQLIDGLNEKIERGELSLDGVSLVTLDIDKMYNNMTEDLGHTAVRKFLDSRAQKLHLIDSDEKLVKSSSIIEALSICLKNNIFQFNGKRYKQKKGVGTGIKLAPPYACMAMGEFEETVFNSNNQLLELLIFWKRFIDDILALFKGTEEEFRQLVDWLNSIMRGIVKFKANFSSEKVEFLDLIISIEEGKLKTNLYIKPSNLQIYLDFSSNHPLHCKVGLVYGQALRIIERCSEESDRDSHLSNLKGKLLARNYPEEVIDSQFNKAKLRKRKELIHQNRSKKQDEKIRCIFTYNQGNPPLHQWIREAQKCLVKNDRARLMGKNIQIAYRQPKNLQKIVTGLPKKGEGVVVNNPGCFKCKSNCHTCNLLIEGSLFRSKNTGRTYKIKQHLTCDSSYVIYLGSCSKCGGQYVGKTSQKFKRRHSGHKQEIKNAIGGLGHHYGPSNGCCYDHLKMQIIEQVKQGDEAQLANREVYWQNQLRCFVQNGGGGHCFRKEK